MSISFVHHFHPKASTVQDVSPGVNHMTLTILNGLVEVEAVQVEGHRAYSQGSKPDTNHRPGSKEKVQTTAVVK